MWGRKRGGFFVLVFTPSKESSKEENKSMGSTATFVNRFFFLPSISQSAVFLGKLFPRYFSYSFLGTGAWCPEKAPVGAGRSCPSAWQHRSHKQTPGAGGFLRNPWPNLGSAVTAQPLRGALL